jgi:predicted adenine nucleotide alpha hydrolase (AANH) superfamily ATPase
MKLLLHCCCAPCSVSCIGSLRTENIFPQLFWYNPNIHPYTEYKSRRDCLNEFAKSENLNLTIIDEYGLREFLNEVFAEEDGFSIPVPVRCKKCYRIRLEKTASLAVQEGYSAFSTTLLISPYQNHDEINLLGEEFSEKYGVDFLYRDFRPLFREGQSAARSKNMYMQKYCGCIFSEEERYLSSDVTRKGERKTANG